jgi:hypothetical protein
VGSGIGRHDERELMFVEVLRDVSRSLAADPDDTSLPPGCWVYRSQARVTAPEPRNRSTSSSPGRAPNCANIHAANCGGFIPVIAPGNVR